jgi:hypothetical protein
MQKMISCKNCGKAVAANPRLKGKQAYCGSRACQNARKNAWQRQKMATDPAYAHRQAECKKQWRQNKPGHLYQKRYRQRNADYVEKNRHQQRQRNRTRQKSDSANASKKIVKMDPLLSAIEKSTLYRMRILTPNLPEKIVKSDALVVQLQKYQPIPP